MQGMGIAILAVSLAVQGQGLPLNIPDQPINAVGRFEKPSVITTAGAGPIAPGTVEGFIVDVTPGAAAEAPLPGADVFVVLGQQIIGQAISDPNGFFSIPSIPQGFYGLVALADGFDLQFTDIQVEPNLVTTAILLMAPLAPCTSCAFLDVTSNVGLGTYVATTGDGHAPGAVFADLNNDGFSDLYLMQASTAAGNSSANQLYLNVPDPQGGRLFKRAINDAGAGDLGNATGAVAGDYDNDGDQDLYVLNFDQPNVLLQNRFAQTGTLQFVDVTASTDPAPGVPDGQFGVGIAFFEGVALDNTLTAAWADVDRDGDLDLYVGNHNGYFGDVPEGPFTVPGRRDVFYMNNGDGTFTDLTMQLGIPGYVSANGLFQTADQSFSSTNAVVFADFDNDLWPDLLVTNKVGGPPDRDMLYINQGLAADGSWLGFQTVTYDLVPAFGGATGCAMGVEAADYDNDGDIDIYMTDCSGQFGSPGLNDLWVNQMSETGALSFTLSNAMPAAFSWGAQWQDFDLDGRLDLHVATLGNLRDFLYMNTANGIIEAAVPLGVPQVRQTRGDVTADFNRDGQPDLFLVNIADQTSRLYQNNFAATLGFNNHFLSVKLTGNPALPGRLRSSRDAIGARIRLSADLDGDGQSAPSEIQLREVLSGNSNSGSTSSLELEFGLGQAPVGLLQIAWPSGRQWAVTVTADQFVNFTEALSGDLTLDGLVDLGDLPVFIDVLLGRDTIPNHLAIADMNVDAAVDGQDIQRFVDAILGL